MIPNSNTVTATVVATALAQTPAVVVAVVVVATVVVGRGAGRLTAFVTTKTPFMPAATSPFTVELYAKLPAFESLTVSCALFPGATTFDLTPAIAKLCGFFPLFAILKTTTLPAGHALLREGEPVLGGLPGSDCDRDRGRPRAGLAGRGCRPEADEACRQAPGQAEHRDGSCQDRLRRCTVATTPEAADRFAETGTSSRDRCNTGVKRFAVAAAIAAVSVVAGTARGEPAPGPLFGIVGSKVSAQQLVRFDPATLAPLPGGLPLAAHKYGWSFSPDGTRLALGSNSEPCTAATTLRIVDAGRLASLGDLEIAASGAVRATAWLAPSRIVAVVGPGKCSSTTQMRVIALDAGTGRIVAKTSLSGTLVGTARAPGQARAPARAAREARQRPHRGRRRGGHGSHEDDRGGRRRAPGRRTERSTRRSPLQVSPSIRPDAHSSSPTGTA